MTFTLAVGALVLAAGFCFCSVVYYAKARLALAAALAVQALVREAQADAEALQQRALDVLAVAEEHVISEEPAEWL